ncbi:predicted protein, partial [Nematostella vectensis]
IATLTFKSATLEDEALYTCVATNALGSVSSSAELQVDEKPEISAPESTTPVAETALIVPIGQEAKLDARVTGSPKPEVEWFKDGKVVEDAGRFLYVEDEEPEVFSLVIDDVQPEDAGKYKCIAFNEKGEVEAEANLSIKEETETAPEKVEPTADVGVKEELTAPEFMDKERGPIEGHAPKLIAEMRPMQIIEGEDAVMTCEVTGKPEPSVEWLKDDKPLPRDQRLTPMYNGEVATLKLQKAILEDEALYTCTASNSLGSVSSSAELQVDEKGVVPISPEPVSPPDIITPLGEIEVQEGEDARFDVRVKGSPQPEIQWYKGTTEIFDEDRFEIVEEAEDNLYSLIIVNTELTDSGKYKVVATNEVGRETSRGELTVTEELQNSRIKMVFDGETCSLTIRDATLDDEGVYKVTLTNEYGTASSTCRVLVN